MRKVFLILESYYGKTKPVYCGSDKETAIQKVERLAERTQCERNTGLELKTRIRFYTNHGPYTYDLYELDIET